MLNKIILIGRLTRDPDASFTTSGIARTTFTLAVDRGFKGADGIDVDFIDIITWRKQAESCGKYLRKGLMTAVSGSLQIRNYETQDGQKRRAAQVVADEVRFLEWADDNGSEAADEALDFDTDNDLPF